MPSLFHYTARSGDGVFLRGSLEAVDAAAALSSLRSRALFVTSLEAAAGLRGAVAGALSGSTSRSALVSFFRSFASLTAAGVPIRRALEVTAQQCGDGRLREALASVAADIESGIALSEALARRPREFARLHVALIRAGETGGDLDEALQRLATLLERERAVRTRMGAALVYPAVVACAAIALIAFLLTSVIPMFRSMYEQLHVPLPRITAILLAAASALHSPAIWAIVSALAALIVSAASQTGSEFRQALTIRLPLFGAIARKAIVATLARVLGTLLRSGVAVVPAIDVAMDAVLSAPYRQSLAALREGLAAGTSFSQPLAASGLYEPLFIQIVRVGEETGALDAMLLRVAEYYELDVEAGLTALGSLVEPLMILILGAVVAFMTAAVFIPLYSIIGNVR